MRRLVNEELKGRKERGLGPFTGRQLTTIIVTLIVGVVAYPIAADATSAAFSNNSATIATVQARNINARGIGVLAIGKRYGLYSKGNLGVVRGGSLACNACVSARDLARTARQGRLIYQHDAAFTGPYHGNQQIASFTVPAGLMCVTATATAYTTATPPVQLFLLFYAGGAPAVNLLLTADQANSHQALGTSGTFCHDVRAGNYAFKGRAQNTVTITDSNDFGSLSVQVFSH
jgi:hypothetical protein